jgi:multidrug resistance efflux pump
MRRQSRTAPGSRGPRRPRTPFRGTAHRAAGCCLLIALSGGCSPREATASDPSASVDRETLRVRRASLRDRILLTGELEAVRSEKVYVPRTRRAWQLPIRWIEQDGATVVEGQKVLELDNSQFTGDLEQTRLARSSAHNDLMRKEADLAGDLADKEFLLEQSRIAVEKARIEAAVPEALRPRREYQEFQLALAKAEFDLAKAEEDLEAARRASEADLEELRIALRRAEDEIASAEQAIALLSLTAPRDGILVVAENPGEGRKFQAGDNVWVGLPVVSIPDLSAMKVAARLSDVDDGRIATGYRAVCTLDAYPETTFAGKVTEIAPIAQEERDQSLKRSFRVEIALDESDPERMRPGMSVKVEIFPPAIEDVLVAPRVALDLTTTPPRAWLPDGSTTEVRLGPCTPTECAIEEGIGESARLRPAG